MKFFKSVFLVYFLTLSSLLAQSGFQSLYNGKIKVKCNCTFERNEMVFESMKNIPNNNLEAAYVALSDKNSSDPMIYNINVYNEEKNYRDIPINGYNYFEKKYLEQYELNLKNIGAITKYINFQGVRALEYQYEQAGIPYNAIVFLKGKKSILLQVGGSLRTVKSEFEALKSNFKLDL